MPPLSENEDNNQPKVVNQVWGSSTLGSHVFLTMPSGQTCWAKSIGLQGVLESGLMGEADSMTAFVGREYIRKVRGARGRPDGEEVDAAKLLKSPETLKKIVKMVDGLTPHIVVDPVVRCHYEVINPGTDEEDTRMIPPDERQTGVIYTDTIGLQDKMFLFNFAMSGVKDAETFRKESEDALGNVVDGEGIQNPSKPNDGPKRKRPPRRR